MIHIIEVGGPEWGRPMEPLNITNQDERDYGSFVLPCPKCGAEQGALHATSVKVVGDDLLVTFWCEQCSEIDESGCPDDAYILIIHQHEGQTEIGWGRNYTADTAVG